MGKGAAWTSLDGPDGLTSRSPLYKPIKRLLQSANFECLAKLAIESRKKNDTDVPADIACIIDLRKFAFGFYNIVLKLTFSDNVHWVARIPYRDQHESHRVSMLSEIATMKIVKKHTKIKVPRVYGFEALADNPVGYPYIFMDFLDGHNIPEHAIKTLSQEQHAKLAEQLADVFADLQNLTFSRIGRLWCGDDTNEAVKIIGISWHSSSGPIKTSWEYFYGNRQAWNKKVMDKHPDDADWLTACWVMKLALAQVVIGDRARGPFPLCHVDLNYQNMLFDDEYNLKGIVDWNNAQAGPLELLSAFHNFQTYPLASDDEVNGRIIELKKLTAEFLKKKEQKAKAKPSLEKEGANKLAQTPNLTQLSTYLATPSSDLASRQHSSCRREHTLLDAKMSVKHMYGDSVTWEQLREMYGNKPLI